MMSQYLSRWFWKIRFFTLILIMIPQISVANETSYEIHYMLIDSTMKGASYQPDGLLYKHIVPYNSFINLEGIVALGITEEKSSINTGVGGRYTQKLKLSNALGLLVSFSGEVEPSVHLYAHFGLARLDYDISSPASSGGPDGSQSDTGLMYGLGMSFHLLQTGAFVLEFNELPDVSAGNKTVDTTVFSLGYQMPF